jgi:hypothetical protein
MQTFQWLALLLLSILLLSNFYTSAQDSGSADESGSSSDQQQPQEGQVNNPTYCPRWEEKTRISGNNDCGCFYCDVCSCTTIISDEFMTNPLIKTENGEAKCKYSECSDCWCDPGDEDCLCCNNKAVCQGLCGCGDAKCSQIKKQLECVGVYTEYSIQSVAPSHAVIPLPNSHSTIVTVTGQNFNSLNTAQCDFEGARVPANYIDNEHMTCAVPVPIGPIGSTSFNVNFRFSMDGKEWTKDDLKFLYIPRCTTSSCKGGTCSADTGECTCNNANGQLIAIGGYDCDTGVFNCPIAGGKPCNNHGRCMGGVKPDGDGFSYCQCDSTWSGTACDSKCELPDAFECNCHNQGSYVVKDGTGQCKCDAGYYGATCDKQMDGFNAQTGLACSGNGHFDTLRGRCVCAYGYSGPACESSCPKNAQDNSICSGVGFCNSKNKCDCSVGRVGEACESFGCAEGCSGNGNCVGSEQQYSCQCEAGWLGDKCEITTNPRADIHGRIKFNPTSYTTPEDMTTLEVKLTRVGGKKGKATVFVHSYGDTATENEDYRGVHKKIEWNDGEDGQKKIYVVILPDALPEANERFTLKLESSSLIDESAAVATVIIKANDQHNVVSGFTASVTYRIDIQWSNLADTAITLQEQIREEFATVFAVNTERLAVAFTKDDESSLTLVTLIIGTDDSGDKPYEVLSRISKALRKPKHAIYLKDNGKLIDKTFHPRFEAQSTTFENPTTNDQEESAYKELLDTSTVKVSTIITIVVISACLLFMVGLYLYYHRVKVSEWVLWKMGGFRFQKLRAVEATEKDGTVTGEFSDYVGPDKDNTVMELELGEVNHGPSEKSLQDWKKEKQQMKADEARRNSVMEQIHRVSYSRKNSHSELSNNNSNHNSSELHDVQMDRTVAVSSLTTKQQQERSRHIEFAKHRAEQNNALLRQSEAEPALVDVEKKAASFEKNVRINKSPVNKRRLKATDDETRSLTSMQDDEEPQHQQDQVSVSIDDAVEVERSSSENAEQ